MPIFSPLLRKSKVKLKKKIVIQCIFGGSSAFQLSSFQTCTTVRIKVIISKKGKQL
jgi:hypothetical protein